MRLLLVILVLTVSAWATPLLVTREGDTVRVTPAPDWSRARIEGTRLVWDVAWPGSVDATDVQVTHPSPGIVRLACPVPQGKTTSITRSRNTLRLSLSPRAPIPPGKRVTQDFPNADAVYVMKVLAKERGYNIYIGPGVEGRFDGIIRSTPPEAALALLLSELEDVAYKVVRHGESAGTFVIAPLDKLATVPDEIPVCPVTWSIPDPVRQEFMLERAPAAMIMQFLQGQHKNVQFTPHPKLNGFSVYGSRKDVLEIKSEVPNLDRTPEPPPGPVTIEWELEHGEPVEARAMLAAAFPWVQFELDGRTLSLTGQPDDIEQALEFLKCPPPHTVCVDGRLVYHSPALARWFALPEQGVSLLRPGSPFPASEETRVVAAPRVGTWWDEESEFFIGDGRLGLSVRLVPERDEDAKFVLHVTLEWHGLESETPREFRFELANHQTVALSNVISAERLEGIRGRPELGKLPILGQIARAVPPGRGLTLFLTPHVLR